MCVWVQSDWNIVKRGYEAHVLGEAPAKFTDPVEAINTLRVSLVSLVLKTWQRALMYASARSMLGPWRPLWVHECRDVSLYAHAGDGRWACSHEQRSMPVQMCM